LDSCTFLRKSFHYNRKMYSHKHNYSTKDFDAVSYYTEVQTAVRTNVSSNSSENLLVIRVRGTFNSNLRFKPGGAFTQNIRKTFGTRGLVKCRFVFRNH
jgi:hypothetical protein